MSFFDAINLGAVAIGSAITSPNDAKEAKETGKAVEDMLTFLISDNKEQLKKHLHSAEFKQELEAAKKGIKNTLNGIKEAKKLALETGTEFLHDTEALGELAEEVLEPLGIDITKLESAACDEILGILEVSALCVEMMAMQKSAEVAFDKVEEGVNKYNKMSNKVSKLTSGIQRGGKKKMRYLKKSRKVKKSGRKNQTKKNT